MRSNSFCLVAVFAGVAVAQNSFTDGLFNALNAANLTSLVGALRTVASEPAGQTLIAELSSGREYTVLAPNNDAFAGVNPFFGNDKTWLGQALAYHVIPGDVSLNNVANNPQTTVYTTALNDSSLVHLGGQGQTIAFTKIRGVTHVANQDYPSVVVNSTQYQKIRVHVVSAVVDLPPGLKDVITTPAGQHYQNLTTLASKAPAALVQTLATSNKLTIFLPVDAAFARAAQRGGAYVNPSEQTLTTLLANHVINGTLVYTGKSQTNYTSAGGQTLTVGTGGLDDGSGSVVYYRGTEVANIIYGDIVTQNGVVHLIDTVLPNTEIGGNATFPGVSPSNTQRRRANSRFFRF